MSDGSAGSTAPAIPATAVPAAILNEGEIIILAIKPSPWFVLLVSWQVLAMAGLLLLVLWLAGTIFNLPAAVSSDMIFWICTAAAGVRVFIACVQWGGRLYVLTNLRVLRIAGAFRADIFQCPLKDVQQVILSATLGERICGTGSLTFITRQGRRDFWMHVSKPMEVQQTILEAISRQR
ncbi:MAG: PH domain-containing protein [Planctomycetaceae bacterium]|nr:MAG: PH domain-containing protein [Planctomycetaceae bacterium]